VRKKQGFYLISFAHNFTNCCLKSQLDELDKPKEKKKKGFGGT
jgi:hypothetical protein